MCEKKTTGRDAVTILQLLSDLSLQFAQLCPNT